MARLANGDVAGRQVEQQFCPRHRRPRGWRQRHPDILADLDVEGEQYRAVRAEEKVGAEGRLMAGDRQRAAAQSDARREMPPFIELAIVRQVALRHRAEDLASVYHNRRIEEPAFPAQRRPDDQHRVEVAEAATISATAASTPSSSASCSSRSSMA